MKKRRTRFCLEKLASSKTRIIVRDALGVVERLEEAGNTRDAELVKNLIKSRIMSYNQNSQLASDLREKIAELKMVQS